jgi:putative transposase
MDTSRSGYYYKSKKAKDNDQPLLDKIKAIATEFPSYGYRRITAHLRREGIIINHKKVYRIMAQNGICCSIRRSYKHTTNSNHGLAKYPNLVKNLVPERLNQVWHADITYIRFAVSFAYLAAIIDGLSRKVVGYAMGKTLSPALTISALRDAIGQRNTDSVIHHSDQGFQYCSGQYVKILKGNGIEISMSEKANPYDNAKMESFFNIKSRRSVHE